MDTRDDQFLALPDGNVRLECGFQADHETLAVLFYKFGVHAVGRVAGVYGQAGGPASERFNSYAAQAGVMGTSQFSTGVAGTSFDKPGVYGQTGGAEILPGGLRAGVIGTGDIDPGVIGWARRADGVQGASFTGSGVFGVSFFGTAVHAVSGADGVRAEGQSSGVVGVSGVRGPTPNFPNIAGVVGTSSVQPGVLGTSGSFAGVFGFSNNVGVAGQTTNPDSFAGYFSGNVLVDGDFTVVAPGAKNVAMPFPDGAHRLLHCMESPEHWFEDFGAARLKNGRATVKLDAGFAKVVKSAGYHVFLTPRGECRGLSVRRQGAGSFEVRELQGGTSNVAFSYRIVARRKDIRRHRRFAKVDTRLKLPKAATRAPRRRKPDAAALRAFVARLEKEARAPKAGRKSGRSRAPIKRWTPRAAR